MTIQGHECGGKQVSQGNVVHSVAKSQGGVGYLVKQDFSNPKHKKCLQASGLIAYKNLLQGAFYQRFGPNTIIFKDMKMIDNGLGVGVGMAAAFGT